MFGVTDNDVFDTINGEVKVCGVIQEFVLIGILLTLLFTENMVGTGFKSLFNLQLPLMPSPCMYCGSK